MAKFELRVGNVLDILSGDEFDEKIAKVIAELKRSQRAPNSMDEITYSITDASGNLPSQTLHGAQAIHTLFLVPAGMTAALHRVDVEAVGYTRAAPLTSGYLNFVLDVPQQDHTFNGLPTTSSATAPAAITESVGTAKIAKAGQRFGVYGAGLPVTTTFSFNVQVQLWETEG